MTICTGIAPSDIPTVDLKLLEIDLSARIDRDVLMLLEIRAELRSRKLIEDNNLHLRRPNC